MDTTKLQKLIDNRVKVAAGGGEAAVEKHHAKGSYTARERSDGSSSIATRS